MKELEKELRNRFTKLIEKKDDFMNSSEINKSLVKFKKCIGTFVDLNHLTVYRSPNWLKLV